MRKKSKKLKKILSYLLVLCSGTIALTLIYFLFSLQAFYIKKITIVPDSYTSLITNTITPILNDKRLYLVPATHTLFTPNRALSKEILVTYQEIKTVTINHSGLDGLKIKIELRTPLFRLDNGLAVDTDGIVYKEPKDIKNLALLESKITLPSKEKLSNIASFSQKISSSLFSIDSIVIDENSDVSYMVQNSYNHSYLITKLEDNVETIWSTLVSAKDTDPFKSTLETSKDNLQYIDLRFGNKVFYKFGKSGSIASTTPVTSSTTSLYDTRILAKPNR